MALPSPLNNVLVQQGNGQVLASWDYQAGSTSYSVMRSTDQVSYIEVGPSSVPQFLDTTVTAGSNYWYKVAGVNGSGTGPYSIPQLITPTLTGQMTLGQMRALSQQRSDMVNNPFISTPEWNTYINQSYFELYDILVQKYGNEYFVNNVVFPTTGVQDYALPDGTNYPDGNGKPARAFYKLLGIDLNIAGQDAWLTLHKYEFISRNRYVYPQIQTNLLGVGGMKYRMLDNNVRFIPTPAAAQTLRLWYIPRMRTLLQDSDVVDGVSGWTEYIVIDAAIKAAQKQEEDVQALSAAKAEIMHRIEAAAENRDAGEPERISNTRRTTGMWGFGDGDGSDGPVGGV